MVSERNPGASISVCSARLTHRDELRTYSAATFCGTTTTIPNYGSEGRGFKSSWARQPHQPELGSSIRPQSAGKVESIESRAAMRANGKSGSPGGSHPRAPTDPGVTVSCHRAPLIHRSVHADPLPVEEQPGCSGEQSVPPPLETLVRPQPPVLVPSPSHQVGADASQEWVHRRSVEPAVVLHPPAHGGIQPPRHVAQGQVDMPVNSHPAKFGAFGLEGLAAHRGQERRETPLRLAVPRLSLPEGEPEEGE